MKTVFRLLCAGLIVILAGCATGQFNWDSQVGVMTYNQAVAKFGQPSRQTKLPDGETVAEWISYYTYGADTLAMNQTFYNSASSLSPIQRHQMQKSTMSLTFGTNNVLTGWSKR